MYGKWIEMYEKRIEMHEKWIEMYEKRIETYEKIYPYPVPLFPSKISDGFGVSFHLKVTSSDIKLMKAAGFKRARIDIFWSQVEKEKGKYDFVTTGYDELNKLLIDNGIQPFYILDYSNQLYEQNQSIVTEEGRKAFANFVSAVTKRYRGQGIIWEIWNEPNIENFWYDQPSYEDYSLLVKEIAPIIKRNDTSGLVVAPALAAIHEDSLKWLEETFKRGILKHLDAVSVHPYRSNIPESVISDYQKIRNLISKYTSNKIPIISGEWGYSMSELNSEEKQAEYLVRMFLVNSWEGIPISVWYDWKNDGYDPENREHNFGIMWRDLQPKLAFKAIKNLSTTLNRYKFVERMKYGGAQDYILKFVNDAGKQVIAFWTTASNHNVTLPLSAGKGKLISMLGTTKDIVWDKDNLILDLSSSPNYLVINSD
ncbi:cellulase family glycosylhydrolase [Ectobacillus funiculus]|uniref:Cellulase family glycosylhydrolase n=1 Tax=Ectobacillus funiculus TaxID=137993 RepID=A0ABV5WJZ9_9BACI